MFCFGNFTELCLVIESKGVTPQYSAICQHLAGDTICLCKHLLSHNVTRQQCSPYLTWRAMQGNKVLADGGSTHTDACISCLEGVRLLWKEFSLNIVLEQLLWGRLQQRSTCLVLKKFLPRELSSNQDRSAGSSFSRAGVSLFPCNRAE